MTNQIIKSLAKFEEKDWIHFIQKLRDEEETVPSIKTISLELYQQLFWIYNTFGEIDPSVQSRFTKCFLDVLDTTEPTSKNTRSIYTFIYFILINKPVRHRDLIATLVRHEKFADTYFSDRNLHLLLIKAYIHIEDKKKLVIQEYLLNNRYKREPYFLYLIMYYYAYLGHSNKALSAFADYFKEIGEANITEIVSKEIFYALRDSIPQHLDLTLFLEKVIKDEITFDLEIPHLYNSVDKFCRYLIKESDNKEAAYFADDVLKNKLEYFPEKYNVEYDKENGKPVTKFDELVSEHTKNYIDNKSVEPKSLETDINKIIEETAKLEPKKIANLYFEQMP